MADPGIRSEWLVVFLAQQRSGTTALRRTLDLGKHVEDLAEVFHNPAAIGDPAIGPSTHPDPGMNFFVYKQRRVRKDPSLIVPSEGNQRRLWWGFLSRLRTSAGKPYVAIDVKYNSAHHLNPLWHLPDRRPALLTWIRSGNARIVHVRRRNLFAQACSSALAASRKEWHVPTGAPVATHEPRTLDPRALEQAMRSTHRHEALYRKWCRGHDRYAELAYEDIFSGDRLAPGTYEALEGLLDVDLDEGMPVPLAKGILDLRNEVANEEELRAHFDGGPFAKQVEAALENSA